MACDKLIRSFAVAELAPAFGELILAIPLEHRETTDVGEISFTASGPDKRRLTLGSNSEACELSLDAHAGRSVLITVNASTARNSSGSPQDKRRAPGSH